MRLARSWLGFGLCLPRGRSCAVPDPEGALDERVIRIGRRKRGRPDGVLQGRLGPQALLAGGGNRDRGLRGERALLRPSDQAAKVRERRAADPAARHPACKLVEELLRQLNRKAGELPLRRQGLGRREPARVVERCDIVRAVEGGGDPAADIAISAVTIIAISIITITTAPIAGLGVGAAFGISAATAAGGSGGYLLYWILGSLITW